MHLWIQCMMTGVLPAGFPHSDIRGSVDICSSPRLFAAYHVFLRLSVPRHPPCALSCLTFCPSPCSVMVTAVLLLRSLYKICKSFLFFDDLRLDVFSNMQFSRYVCTALPCDEHPWDSDPSAFACPFRLCSFSLYSIPSPGPLFHQLAATCSPVPSPAKYHRPLKS